LAPAIFQRTMKTIIQGMEHVQVYTDDIIIITRKIEEEHLANLENVLYRLEKARIHLK